MNLSINEGGRDNEEDKFYKMCPEEISRLSFLNPIGGGGLINLMNQIFQSGDDGTYYKDKIQMKKDYENFIQIFEETKQLPSGVVFCWHVSIAVDCGFMGEIEEAYKWCEDARRALHKLEKRVHSIEVIFQNKVRLYNLYGDILTRKNPTKNEIRKALEYLYLSRRLLESIKNLNLSKPKHGWRIQNLAFNLMNKAQALFKREGRTDEVVDYAYKAYDRFVEGKKSVFINLCIERMNSWGIHGEEERRIVANYFEKKESEEERIAKAEELERKKEILEQELPAYIKKEKQPEESALVWGRPDNKALNFPKIPDIKTDANVSGFNLNTERSS